MQDALNTRRPKGVRLARIGIRAALVGTVLAALSGLGAWAGVLSPFQSMGAYSLGSLLLLIALLTAALELIRSRGSVSALPRTATWVALLVGLLVTGNNILLMGKARGAPPIHDITTDTLDPPAFVALLPLRALDAQNPPEYSGPEAAAAQQKAFPDLQPLKVRQSAGEVFAAAKSTVVDQGWTLVDANEAEGRIEATAETDWVRFKDDVVIRVRTDLEHTRVDVRSKSRVGRGDMGANARRVRAYLERLKNRLTD